MQNYTFTITSDEVQEVSKIDLTESQVKKVLEFVECDEMLARDIRNAILLAINEVVSE